VNEDPRLSAWVREHLERLSGPRRAHSERVAEWARELARRNGVSEADAYWAGLAHDLARELSSDDLLAEARRLGIRLGPEEVGAPILLHGPVAAGWMEESGFGHPGIWAAIRLHTTAGPELSLLARAVFIADGTEPGRRFAEAPGLRDLARRDLEAGYRGVLDSTARYLASRGLTLHPLTRAALAGAADGLGP
jgi:predicted HD superfamily hydrolase involved in NAD metabolism